MLVYTLGDQLELVTPKEVLEKWNTCRISDNFKRMQGYSFAKVGIHF